MSRAALFLLCVSLMFCSPAPAEAAGPQLKSLGEFRMTAYCACQKCCGKWSEHGLTASGTEPEEGRTVAVDEDKIPLGSVVVIGGEEYIAEDTGSKIKGSRVDIYFDSHEDAVEFGIQRAEVFVGEVEE